MRVLGILTALLITTGCASKNKINAYTQPSSRHPSSAFSFSPQKSKLLFYNTSSLKEEQLVTPIVELTMTSTGLQMIGYTNASEVRGCFIPKAKAAQAGVSIGELALLVKGGVDVVCHVIGDDGSPVRQAQNFSFKDHYQ